MSETQAQREARWAAGKARQEAYAASPEAAAIRAERIAQGLCVIERCCGDDVCVTHQVTADFDHYLAVSPSHSAQGIATND